VNTRRRCERSHTLAETILEPLTDDLADHLLSCPVCQREWQALHQLSAYLDDASARGLLDEPAPRATAPSIPRPLLRGLSVAALFLVVLGGGTWQYTTTVRADAFFLQAVARERERGTLCQPGHEQRVSASWIPDIAAPQTAQWTLRDGRRVAAAAPAPVVPSATTAVLSLVIDDEHPLSLERAAAWWRSQPWTWDRVVDRDGEITILQTRTPAGRVRELRITLRAERVVDISVVVRGAGRFQISEVEYRAAVYPPTAPSHREPAAPAPRPERRPVPLVPPLPLPAWLVLQLQHTGPEEFWAALTSDLAAIETQLASLDVAARATTEADHTTVAVAYRGLSARLRHLDTLLLLLLGHERPDLCEASATVPSDWPLRVTRAHADVRRLRADLQRLLRQPEPPTPDRIATVRARAMAVWTVMECARTPPVPD